MSYAVDQQERESRAEAKAKFDAAARDLVGRGDGELNQLDRLLDQPTRQLGWRAFSDPDAGREVHWLATIGLAALVMRGVELREEEASGI